MARKRASPARRAIVQMIARSESGILLTSYDQLRLQRQLLLGVSWGYAILDEGHKIRNPDAEAGPRASPSARELLPAPRAAPQRVALGGAPQRGAGAEYLTCVIGLG